MPDANLFATALPDGQLAVARARGREALSSLYRFTVEIERPTGPLPEATIDELLASPCTFELGTSRVHGLADRIEQREGEDGATIEIDIVPSVSLLTTAAHAGVFGMQSVRSLVGDILGSYGLETPADYDILTPLAPTFDQALQLRESDWNFVERWLAHVGAGYWFEQRDNVERLAIADTAADAPLTDPSHPYLAYRTQDGSTPRKTSTLWGFRVARSRAPAKVALVDDVDIASGPHVARAEVPASAGFGTAFVTAPPGGATDEHARRIAETIGSNHKRIFAQSDSTHLRAGHRFDLLGHPDPAYDGGYIVVAAELRFDGGRAIVDLEAQSVDLPLPAPTTRVPPINGLLRARVVSADEDVVVELPLIASGRRGRRLRVSLVDSSSRVQPGQLVAVAFLGGHPDRPVALPSSSAAASRALDGVRLELK